MFAKHNEITLERLRSVINYCPSTGIFTWAMARKRCALGAKAGSISWAGYIIIRIDKNNYRAHNLAFFMMTGAWPDNEIDHKDANKSNNAWVNLRAATRGQNIVCCPASKRCVTGVRGVSLHPKTRRFRAYTCIEGGRQHLGYFATLEEAKAARRSAVMAHYGEFGA
jgi:hypothetical protein